MATTDHQKTAPQKITMKNNQTLYAIIASAVIATVLATVFTGSPFRALRLGYIDYSNTPAAGAPAASSTQAPASQK